MSEQNGTLRDLMENYRAIVSESDTLYERVEAERARLYDDAGQPRYDKDETARRLRNIAADPELGVALRDSAERYQRVFAEMDTFMREAITEAEAELDAVGRDPLSWTYRPTADVAAQVAVCNAAMDALDDSEAVEHVGYMLRTASQSDAVGWLLAARRRLRHLWTREGMAKNPQLSAEARRLIGELSEKARGDRVRGMELEAEIKLERLQKARREIAAMVPRIVQERASKAQRDLVWR